MTPLTDSYRFAGGEISELPVVALSRPAETLSVAESVLAETTDARSRSFARQARGIALRELGDVPGATRELRRALRDASAVSATRAADVEASLGGTLAYAGRYTEALELLDSALSKTAGAAAARIRMRRGLLLGMLGRHEEAIADLRATVRTLRRAGDSVWEGRALVNLAESLLELGQTRQADAALTRAEQLQRVSEQPFEAATTRQLLGLVAELEGRIPDALTHYETAEQAYAASGARPADLSDTRAGTLLSAGLFRDALESANEAVEILRRPGASATYLAEALVRAGTAALAVGDSGVARKAGKEALRLFTRQSRERGAVRARLVVVRARYLAGERNRPLLREIALVAEAATQQRMTEAVTANLLAGELALEIDDRPSADLHLTRAKRARSSRSSLTQVLGWQATALAARASGRGAGVHTACERGLQVLEGHQLTLGAIETRAAATTLGRPLAAMGLAAAVESGDPAAMLHWTERQRATLFRLPPVRMAHDSDLAATLAQLRLARARLEEAEHDGAGVQHLQREITTLEADVRNRTLRLGAAGVDSLDDLDAQLRELPKRLGEVRLVELFQLDDDLHALVVDADSVRHHVIGPYGAALRSAEYAGYALRRLWRRNTTARATAVLPNLAAVLEREVLGPVVHELDGAPAVVVPPASLSSIPWGLLPSLRERAFSVAPSAVSWLAARRSRPPASGRVAVVAGPRLHHAAAEVDKVAQLYPHPAVLRPGQADSSAVLSSLDGAATAHVAAHGRFRGDNPMFSSFILDDGPLTVFDLQKLRHAPHRLVLSSCDTGSLSVAGADEVLGLASALIPLGTAGLLAPTIAVVDEAAVEFALLIHQRLVRGGSTAEALRDARLAAGDNPATFAIAHSFTAFGAA